MRRTYIIAVLAVALGALLAMAADGCGGGHPHKASRESLRAPAVKAQAQRADSAVQAATTPQERVKACDKLPEGYGHMGVCVPKEPQGGSLRPPLRGQYVLGIDTSHWDYCSGAVVRAPRFWFVSLGDGGYVDHCAPLVYGMLKRAGIPHGFYYYVRPSYTAQQSARQAFVLARAAGWSPQDGNTFKIVNDAEALGSCGQVGAVDYWLKHYFGGNQVIDYDSPGLWPGGCRSNAIGYTAEYGPFYQTLSGLGNTVFWQYTDGQVGPGPHCWGVCGDVDRAVGNTVAALYARPKPPPPPIAFTYWQACAALDADTYWKYHGGRGHVSAQQHRHDVAIKRRLRRAGIGCARPGWMLRPRKGYTSYPVHGNGRRGNLA